MSAIVTTGTETAVSVIQERMHLEVPRRRPRSSTTIIKHRPSYRREHRPRSSSSSPSSSSTSPSTTCNLLPSGLGGLDLAMASMHSPAPILASLRVLVLSHLAELEKRLTADELKGLSRPPSPPQSPSRTASPKSKKQMEGQEGEPIPASEQELEAMTEWWPENEETMMDEALHWAQDTLSMLRQIRSDVSSHLPDLPPDIHALEDLLRTHLPDLSYQSLLDELRAHLPDFEFMKGGMAGRMEDVQTKLKDVKTHIREMSDSFSSSLDLSQPMNYLPVLSAHLNSLHTHLSLLSSQFPSHSHPSHPSLLPSLPHPTTSTLSELLDRLLSSDLVPEVLHRVDGHDSPLEKAAREMSEALKKSLDGARLVSYMDLPGEWRNNPWVNSGYRFIPLHKWPIILLSLFALHNETLNIHTHMIPLLHTAFRFFPTLNYALVPLDGPEKAYTAFTMLCLFGSVVWHTMSGCAHRVGMELCARVDYVGIGWLISASVGTIVYYGFSCHSQATLMYLSLCVVTGIAGSIFPFMSWFNDRKYKPARIAFFLGMAFTGLAPFCHLAYLYSLPSTLAFISHIFPSLLSYIIGLIFYVTHVPERFVAVYNERMARWTDWLGGGSHAIWHAFIVLAIYQHKWGMREMRAGIGGEECLM